MPRRERSYINVERIYMRSYSTHANFTAIEWLEARELSRTDPEFKVWLKRHRKEK